MALTEGKSLVNIVRAEIVTEETTPITITFDTAQEASVEPFVSEGEENIQRVKNKILAVNRTEDIVVGYDTTLINNTLIAEALAIIDGGTLSYSLVTLAEALGTGDDTEVVFNFNETPISIQAIYVDGVETTDFTAVGGAITMDTAPASGIAVTGDCTYAVSTFETGAEVVGYNAPIAGTAVARKLFTLNLFTEEKDIDGETLKYAKFSFAHNKGTPVKYSIKDGEFFVPEFTAKARPKSGESPLSINYLDTLPTLA